MAAVVAMVDAGIIRARESGGSFRLTVHLPGRSTMQLLSAPQPVEIQYDTCNLDRAGHVPQQQGHHRLIAQSHAMLGLCRIADREWSAAHLAFITALRALDEIDDRTAAVATLACLGSILTELGQYRAAASVLHEAVVTAQIIGDEFGELQCAWAVAFLAARSGRIDDAVRMDEALAERLTTMERGIPAVLLADYTTAMEEARQTLRRGPSQTRHFRSEWLLVRALELTCEIASSPSVPLLAAVPVRHPPRRSTPKPGPEQQESHIAFRPPLTNRELEILSAIAGGETNAQIAASLSLSAKTVMHHTTSIYRKLGVRGRAGAVDLAHRTGMLRPPSS